jgi:hypothetical protein
MLYDEFRNKKTRQPDPNRMLKKTKIHLLRKRHGCSGGVDESETGEPRRLGVK